MADDLAALVVSGILSTVQTQTLPEWRFADELTREVIYQSLPGQTLRELHRRAAEHVAAHSACDWARIAHHWMEADLPGRAFTPLRRAGLDYHEWADVQRHASWDALVQRHTPGPTRCFAFTTRGSQPLHSVRLLPGDWLVFGSETAGLAPALRDSFAPAQRVRLPMRPGQRSLNLSNAVAVAVFEAWRQNDYAGGA